MTRCGIEKDRLWLSGLRSVTWHSRPACDPKPGKRCFAGHWAGGQTFCPTSLASEKSSNWEKQTRYLFTRAESGSGVPKKPRAWKSYSLHPAVASASEAQLPEQVKLQLHGHKHHQTHQTQAPAPTLVSDGSPFNSLTVDGTRGIVAMTLSKNVSSSIGCLQSAHGLRHSPLSHVRHAVRELPLPDVICGLVLHKRLKRHTDEPSSEIYIAYAW